MNQEIQPLFEVDAMKVAVGSTPDPEVTALTSARRASPLDAVLRVPLLLHGLHNA